MRVREKPKRFLPARPKKKPRTHPGPEKREKRVAGFLKAQRESLPISSTSLVNRTQAAFLALPTASTVVSVGQRASMLGRDPLDGDSRSAKRILSPHEALHIVDIAIELINPLHQKERLGIY
jgi:hypothetical protein